MVALQHLPEEDIKSSFGSKNTGQAPPVKVKPLNIENKICPKYENTYRHSRCCLGDLVQLIISILNSLLCLVKMVLKLRQSFLCYNKQEEIKNTKLFEWSTNLINLVDNVTLLCIFITNTKVCSDTSHKKKKNPWFYLWKTINIKVCP